MTKLTVKILLFSVILFSLFYSCEKDITVDIPKPDSLIVVEGYIEQGQNPYVVLTKNSPYFETVDSNSLQKLIVQNATVSINDGTNDYPLTLSINFNQFPFLFYSTNQLFGEIGKTYLLTVKVNGKVLTAKTTIPEPVKIDSLVFKPEAPYDSLGFLWFYFVDPDTLGNFYRIFTKVIGEDSIFVHPYSSVADDQVINGQEVEYSTYNPPENRFEEDQQHNQEDDLSFYFKKEQTVILKLCNITAEHYYFWKTVEQQINGGGNPFASPATVRTNIKGGGLGIWGSYGAYIDTIYIKN